MAWFRLPIEPGETIPAVEVLNDILIITGIILNIVLLWMIWKNPEKKPRNNKALLLANLCIVNLVVTIFGSICSIETKLESARICTYKSGAILTSLVLPKYYPSVFLLTLTQYALIVKPLKFQTMDPRKNTTTIAFICINWLVVAAVMIITPNFVHDFDEYLKAMVLLLVCLCWIITVAIAYMYMRTLYTLWKRSDILQEKLNVSGTEQGSVIISQNIRLAKTMFFFIVSVVIFTLISNTAYLFLLYCSECDQHALVKVCLYTMPLFMATPAVILPINWIIGTPQYWKELKKRVRKLAFCRCVGDD